jgi:NAD(P)-dependent dehydrogenase (short-subunit alcohol dehydrogenase family)
MAMELRLDGRTALVTGASSGLGERFATVLAAAGAQVVVSARRLDRLTMLAERITEAGGRAVPVAMDVANVPSIEAAVERAETLCGPIHILVNNSGVSVAKRIGDYSEADYDTVMDINTRGAFFVAQSVGRRMVARGRDQSGPTGRIINIASAAGLKVLAQLSVYAMSKAAVVQMTRAMAHEWGRFGINVNAICPGYIETDINREHWNTDAGKRLLQMLPRRRLGQVQDLDGLVLLLASDAAGFINGAIIAADDGMTAA